MAVAEAGPPLAAELAADAATGAVSRRTYVLGAGAFAVGTCAFVMSGLLVAITAALHSSAAAVGQLTTVFTATCAVVGPVAAAVTRHWPRRRLLTAALLVCGAGEALSASASSLLVLAAAQALAASGAATFLPTASAVATALNPPQLRARAIAAVFIGVPMALLLGVPAAAAAANLWGFRVVLGLVAGVCVVAAAGVAVWVPPVPAGAAIGLRERWAAAVDRDVVAALVVTLLICASTGVLYTYLAAVLAAQAAAGPVEASMALAAYGVGAVLGNSLGGWAGDRLGAARAVVVGTAGCLVLLACVAVAAGAVAAAVVLIAVWGVAFSAVMPAVTSWLVELAPAQPGLLLPVGTSAIYLGRGCGCLLGGLVIDRWGIGAVAPGAVVLAAAALAVALTPSASRENAWGRGIRAHETGCGRDRA